MSGQGVGNDSYYEYFVCAEQVSYKDVGSGMGLYADGARQVNSGYMYRYGTESISQVDEPEPRSNYSTFGIWDRCIVACLKRI